jgi:hypothetical protein
MRTSSLLSRRALLGGFGTGLAALGTAYFWPRKESETDVPPAQAAAPAGPLGCFFDVPPADPFAAPNLRIITIPPFRGAAAIWGATGRDARGHIWFGVAAHGVEAPSAHLFEYLPESGQVLDRGAVVAELRRCGVLRAGESQMKIHSKIVQADDAHVYFASMDEEGEREDGSRLPTWGGHMWRLRLSDNRWEHLFATPEALIAVAAAPGLAYALGYFDHVLYQYNCRTGASRSVHVGSVGGHISRNFLVDGRGHAFVPRLRARPGAAAALATTLVEMDTELHEVHETPIGHYTQTRDENSHGILGVQPLADRSLVFATDRGFLYHIRPRAEGPAAVEELGWFHPRGESYVGSLFTYDGVRHLMGLSRRQWNNEDRYEWLVYDLTARTSRAVPVNIPTLEGRPLQQLLLYGSMTRDNRGNFYVVGTHHRDHRDWPILLQAVRA